MVSVKKVTLAISTALIALAIALLCFGGVFSTRAEAYDGLPGEFGSIVGDPVEDSTGKYVNYQRGYVKYAADATDTSEPRNAVAHVGGKHAVKNGDAVTFELISAADMTSVHDWDTLVKVGEEKNRIAYGPGWNAEAAKAVGNAFKTKWEACIAAGYNLGIPRGFEVFNPSIDDPIGHALMFALRFRYGDSVYDPDDGNGGGKNACDLIYNTLTHEVYLVADGFMRLIPGETRRIGAPVSEQIQNATVTGWDGEGHQLNYTGKTVQVFETGILVGTEESNDKVTQAVKHEGVVEKISDTEYKMHPLVQDQDVLSTGRSGKTHITVNGQNVDLGFIGDIDGTWHALRTARTHRNTDNKLVVQFNFRAGCVEVVYNDDYTLASRMAYAGQNFAYDGSGVTSRVNLPFETFTTGDHLWEDRGCAGVEDNAFSTFTSYEGNESKSKDDLKALFREGYKTLFDAGVIPGYRCSAIKMWDVLCLDYKYSPDSRYGFDGIGSAGRERMYTLVYSPKQNKVYGVGDDMWQAWKEDAVRPALGAPISNEMQNKTISGKTFARIQIFEKGYIYATASGKLVTEFGATTDNAYTEFVYEIAPKTPSEYGVQTGKIETEDCVYVNYTRGAVKAIPSVTGLGYVYELFPGRNFEQSGETVTAKMLPFDTLYKESDFHCSSAYDGIFNGENGAKQQIQDAIKDLLQKGFFPGFINHEGLSAWNDSACMQLFYGDSTACPFGGDARTNVAAFIYNERMKKIFLLKDAFMDAWGKSQGAYTTLGSPAGNEFTLAANPNIIFQMFEDTSAHDGKAYAAAVGYNEVACIPSDAGMTPEQYLQKLADLNDPVTGITITPPEYTEFYIEDVTFMDFEYEIAGGTADAQITVQSSNEDIAKVMADGTVEFYKAGTVTITVSVSDGVHTFSDSVTFTVKSKESGGCGSAAAGTSVFFAALALLLAAAVVFVKKTAKAK